MSKIKIIFMLLAQLFSSQNGLPFNKILVDEFDPNNSLKERVTGIQRKGDELPKYSQQVENKNLTSLEQSRKVKSEIQSTFVVNPIRHYNITRGLNSNKAYTINGITIGSNMNTGLLRIENLYNVFSNSTTRFTSQINRSVSEVEDLDVFVTSNEVIQIRGTTLIMNSKSEIENEISPEFPLDKVSLFDRISFSEKTTSTFTNSRDFTDHVSSMSNFLYSTSSDCIKILSVLQAMKMHSNMLNSRLYEVYTPNVLAQFKNRIEIRSLKDLKWRASFTRPADTAEIISTNQESVAAVTLGMVLLTNKPLVRFQTSAYASLHSNISSTFTFASMNKIKKVIIYAQNVNSVTAILEQFGNAFTELQFVEALKLLCNSTGNDMDYKFAKWYVNNACSIRVLQSLNSGMCVPMQQYSLPIGTLKSRTQLNNDFNVDNLMLSIRESFIFRDVIFNTITLALQETVIRKRFDTTMDKKNSRDYIQNEFDEIMKQLFSYLNITSNDRPGNYLIYCYYYKGNFNLNNLYDVSNVENNLELRVKQATTLISWLTMQKMSYLCLSSLEQVTINFAKVGGDMSFSHLDLDILYNQVLAKTSTTDKIRYVIKSFGNTNNLPMSINAQQFFANNESLTVKIMLEKSDLVGVRTTDLLLDQQSFSDKAGSLSQVDVINSSSDIVFNISNQLFIIYKGINNNINSNLKEQITRFIALVYSNNCFAEIKLDENRIYVKGNADRVISDLIERMASTLGNELSFNIFGKIIVPVTVLSSTNDDDVLPPLDSSDDDDIPVGNELNEFNDYDIQITPINKPRRRLDNEAHITKLFKQSDSMEFRYHLKQAKIYNQQKLDSNLYKKNNPFKKNEVNNIELELSKVMLEVIVSNFLNSNMTKFNFLNKDENKCVYNAIKGHCDKFRQLEDLKIKDKIILDSINNRENVPVISEVHAYVSKMRLNVHLLSIDEYGNLKYFKYGKLFSTSVLLLIETLDEAHIDHFIVKDHDYFLKIFNNIICKNNKEFAQYYEEKIELKDQKHDIRRFVYQYIFDKAKHENRRG